MIYSAESSGVFALGSNNDMRPTIEVTAAVIIQNNRVFAAKRGKERHLAGYWEFPGGKIEAGETAKECLQRELAEELNISTTIGPFIMKTAHAYGDKNVVLHVYQVRRFSGDIKLVDHDEFRWLLLSECKTLNWAPADVPIFDELASLLNNH